MLVRSDVGSVARAQEGINSKGDSRPPFLITQFYTNFVFFEFYHIFFRFGILGWIRIGHDIAKPFVN